MKRALNSFTIAIILLLTITSCSTECDEPTQIRLSLQNYYVPYSGYDTLRFLHNNIDTQVFVGEGLNYFWVTKPPFDDTECPEDHQSLFIRFKNRNSGYTLTLYYVYDYWMFGKSNFLRFELNNSIFINKVSTARTDSIYAAGNLHSIVNLVYFASQLDTSSYLFYKVPAGGFGGVLKFKISDSDYYTLL